MMTDHTDHPPLTDEELAYNRWASEGQPELTDEEFEAAPLLSRYGKESEVRRLCLRLISELRHARAELAQLRTARPASRDVDWYTLVPEDEHSSNHRYCDPTLCPALTRTDQTPRTWLDLARSVAQEFGVDLSPAAAEAILWEHTGFPGFWEGDPIECCTNQLREYFAAQPHNAALNRPWRTSPWLRDLSPDYPL